MSKIRKQALINSNMTVFIKDILNQGNLIKWIIVFNSFKFIGGNKLTTASFATFFSLLIAEKPLSTYFYKRH